MSSPESQSTEQNTESRSQQRRIRLAMLIILAVIVAVVYQNFGHFLTLDYLAAQEQQLRHALETSPALVMTIAFLVYVAVTGLSLPGAAALSLAYAWLFGFVPTVILVSFASTTGASIAFLLSRYLFGDAMQKKYADRLVSINQELDADGPFYLFTLRLIPAVPFFVINVVMGLTRIPLRTFWLVSQIGMLPGTMAYVYAGSSVPDLQTLNERGLSQLLSRDLLLAFVVLGTLPLILKKAVDLWRWRRASSRPDPQQPDENSDQSASAVDGRVR